MRRRGRSRSRGRRAAGARPLSERFNQETLRFSYFRFFVSFGAFCLARDVASARPAGQRKTLDILIFYLFFFV